MSNSTVNPTSFTTPNCNEVRTEDALLIESLRHDLTIWFIKNDCQYLPQFKSEFPADLEDMPTADHIAVLQRWHATLCGVSQ